MIDGPANRTFAVIDIGNTRIAVGRWENSAVMDTVRVDADDRTGLTQALTRLHRGFPADASPATGIASVAPDTLAWVDGVVQAVTGRGPVVIGRNVPLPMPINVRHPERVGVDRVCSAAAAFRRVRGTCIVVQFGTAVTVDVVADDGVFLGGAILPGLAMQARALHEFTAALPLVAPNPPEQIIGGDTEEAIRSGIVIGTAGAVRGLVEGIATQLGKWPQVIATGGDAARMAGVAAATDFFDSLVPDLCLMGIGDCLNDRFAPGDDDHDG